MAVFFCRVGHQCNWAIEINDFRMRLQQPSWQAGFWFRDWPSLSLAAQETLSPHGLQGPDSVAHSIRLSQRPQNPLVCGESVCSQIGGQVGQSGYRKLELRSRAIQKARGPGVVMSALTGKWFVIDRLQSADWGCGVVSKLPLNIARVVGS